MVRTGDRWHCSDCWEQFHHDGYINGVSDWEDEKTFRSKHKNFLPLAERLKKFREEQVKE